MANNTAQGKLLQVLPAANSRRKRWWAEAGLIVAFWTCIFMFTVVQRGVDSFGTEGFEAGLLWHTAFEYVLWLLVTPLIFWMARRFSLEKRPWLRNVLLHIAAAFGVAIIVDAVSHIVFPVHPQPYSLGQGILGFGFFDELIIGLVVIMAGFARGYFWQYQERQKEAVQFKTKAAELQAQLAEARLAALRMQINPHFLFNTLHAISSLIDEDARSAQRVITRLSKLLRYALDNTDVQEVSLREEMNFLKDYLQIQQIRFEDQLEVQLEVPQGLQDALVPSLILQPLVENAIKHGARSAKGVGRVEVQVYRETNHLLLCVSDNGPGLDGFPANGTDGVGLHNTRERLENLYGGEAALTLESSSSGGLRVSVTVPYHTSGDLSTTTVSFGK